LVESRASETVGAAAARRDSRSRAAREWKGTAAEEEEGNGVTRRGGRCRSEVESAVGVAMEAGRSGASAPALCGEKKGKQIREGGELRRGNGGERDERRGAHYTLARDGPAPGSEWYGAAGAGPAAA
jgi:hypothetical protein